MEGIQQPINGWRVGGGVGHSKLSCGSANKQKPTSFHSLLPPQTGRGHLSPERCLADHETRMLAVLGNGCCHPAERNGFQIQHLANPKT